MASLAWVDLLAEPNTDAIVGGSNYATPPVAGTITVSAGPWDSIFFNIFLLQKKIDSLGPTVWGDPTILGDTQIFGIEAAGNFAGTFTNPSIQIYKPAVTMYNGSFDETYTFEEDPLLLENDSYKIMTASSWYPNDGGTGTSFTLTKFKVYIEVAGFFWTNRNLTRELPL